MINDNQPPIRVFKENLYTEMVRLKDFINNDEVRNSSNAFTDKVSKEKT